MKTPLRSIVLLCLTLWWAPQLRAQQPVPQPPAASPADVRDLPAILRALYDVISGPAGQARNWDRMRSLFIPEARLIPTGRRSSGEAVILVWSLAEYIERAGPRLEENGFFEREVARRVQRFGSIAQVFSTYESRRKAEDPAPFVRGINSIQLWWDGTRWWIANIMWDSERPDNPIPEQFLTSAD